MGITLHQWNLQGDNLCPRCNLPEDCQHVLLCQARGANESWTTNLQQLDATLTTLSTPTLLHEAIILRLTQWRQSKDFTTPTTWDPGITSVIHSQDSIGWKNFLEGLPSTLWTPYIQQHYTESGIKKNPNRWLLRLLRHLHDLAWGQWDHRNQILHQIDTPRQHRAITHLDTVIAQEFHAYTLTLTPSLQPYFISSLGSLIFQNLSYKQAWYMNLMSAKQQHHRLASVTGHPLQDFSPPDERLLTWIKSGYYY